MRSGVIAFLLGILALQALPQLPDRHWTLALPLGLLVLVSIPWLRLPAGAVTGFLWALWLTPAPLGLPAALEGAEVVLEGWIATLPDRDGSSVRFEFDIASIDGKAGLDTPLVGRRVRLSGRDEGQAAGDEQHPDLDTAPVWQVGDRWQLTVRLKRPWGLHNPGGFDYERWLYAKGLVATGSIRSQPAPQRLAAAERYPLDQYRQHIAERFTQQLPGNPWAGVLIALAIGEEGLIPAWQWELFNRIGIGHLMSISGSHVGLVTGLIFALAWALWSRSTFLTLRWPATRAAALLAWLGAGGYILLSGLSVPAQRSFLMVTVALLALLLQRPVATSRGLALALLIVLVADPNAPLQVGFWLSFGAVAAILYSVSGRWHDHHGFGEAIRLQLHISLALLPLTLLFFQQFPLLSPLANLIAIPWTACTVLPLSVLAALLTPFSESLQTLLLQMAAMTMEGLWQILLWLDRWSDATMLYRPAPPLWTLALVLPGIALWLAPRGLPARWLGLPLCLPLLWPSAAVPTAGGFWFTLLDVGEGLATVVRTREHTLVYDTGRRLGGTLDTGRTVLVPFLRNQGAKHVDVLVVSHADPQHTGGVRSLREALPVRRILTAAPDQTPIDGAEPCRSGQSWEWDGVQFDVLHPPPTGFSTDNASCVLKITGPSGRVLLPGDIETGAETALVQRYGSGLAAEVLVAPHQGRRNLSTAAFLEAVHPRYILLATGYGNRYGYPRADTVAKYQATGAALLDASHEGALTFRLDGGQALEPERYRQQQRRFWKAAEIPKR